MKAYQYDASGYFAGEIEDYGGPLPNNATRTAPREQDGHIPRWNGNVWEQMEDRRETEYWLPAEGDDWQSAPRKMTAPGPLPPGAVTMRPEKPLETVRAEALARLNADFAAASTSGRLFSAIGFPIDATARANRDIAGLITSLEASGAETVMFCDHDNAMRSVTLADLKAMQLEIIAYGQALYARKWALREKLAAAATKDAIDAVAWDAALHDLSGAGA